MGAIKDEKGKYYSIHTDGTLRLPVEKGTPEAVTREYETKDGAKKEKTELVFKAYKGTIKSMSFYDGQFGKNLNVFIVDSDGDGATISFHTDDNFGTDFMKKLPNINLDQELIIRPYSFPNEKKPDKMVKGVAITQGENIPVDNHFWDKEKKEVKNGFPAIEKGKEYSSDDWKIYFMQVKKFLVEYTEENILPKFPDKRTEVEKESEGKSIDDIYPDDEINPEDIPF